MVTRDVLASELTVAIAEYESAREVLNRSRHRLYVCRERLRRFERGEYPRIFSREAVISVLPSDGTERSLDEIFESCLALGGGFSRVTVGSTLCRLAAEGVLSRRGRSKYSLNCEKLNG